MECKKIQLTVTVVTFLSLAFSDCWPQSQSFRFTNFIPQRQPRQRVEMTEACLACICEASSGCALDTRCISNGKYCGPFLISKPYWIDGGKSTLIGDHVDRNGAFEDCAMDPVCSAKTVRNYMERFQTDCNRDNIIDCDDMGRIHLMGRSGCANPRVPRTPFYRRFRQCFDKVLQFTSLG